MAATLIGTLRPRAKGVHVQANAYNIMDVVTGADGSKAYMAVKDVPAGTALADTEYWCIYTDLSAVKSAMENASAQALSSAVSANEAIGSLTDYTSEYALRVRGETAFSEGNPVQIAPDAGSLLRPVTVFEPVQGGSGDPSPENIRPISGYDSLSLTRCGKNLLPNTATTQTINGVTFTVDSDGTVTANGTATDTIIFYTAIDVPVAAGSYVLNGGPAGGSINTYSLRLMTPDGLIYDDIGAGYAFECAGENINVMIIVRSGYTASNLTFYPMLRLATETDADYVPYQGDAYTVRIGQTVCGGRMNWLTGEMLVEYDCVVLDGVKNTLSAVNGWNNQLYGFELGKAGYKRPMPLGGGVCSHFPVLNDRAGTTACHPSSDGVGRLYIGVLPGVSNADEYNARLQADPITCAYRIDEPYVIQLTPHQILALQGANTLLGGGGAIEVEWVKPLATSIEERIAAVLAAMQNA